MKITLTYEEIGRWANHHDDLGLLLMCWAAWAEQTSRPERGERMAYVSKMIVLGPIPAVKAACSAVRGWDLAWEKTKAEYHELYEAAGVATLDEALESDYVVAEDDCGPILLKDHTLHMLAATGRVRSS